MARWKLNHGRSGFSFHWLLLSVVGWSVGSLSAQELPLKRDVPGSGLYACPPVPAGSPPGEEERSMAGQLASSAAQAVILGNLDQARSFLDRATQLDPSSADLAYRHARVLEDLGDGTDAMSEYCRVLSADSVPDGANDARSRLEALAAATRPVIAESAIAAFQEGVILADAGGLGGAVAAFDSATANAPEWPEAVYDRGVVLARLGRTAESTRDLRRYLELRPDAPDAIAISQRIGELQSMALVSTPNPGTGLVLGILVPGMGQFYSGRALGGMTVFALAGGAVATAFLVKKVDVLCLSEPGPGATCPPNEVVREEVHRPYRVAGLSVAAAIGVIGAIEAFVNLRGRRRAGQGVASIDLGPASLGGLDVAASRGRVDLRLLHLAF